MRRGRGRAAAPLLAAAAAVVAIAAALCGLVPMPAAAESPGERPAVGRLLVADRALLDPNFRRTVVLLVEYGEREGAMGLVLNRPAAIEVGSFLADVPGLEEHHDPVFVGGPVEPFRAALLVRAPEPPEHTTPVIGDLHFSTSRSLLERLAGEPRPKESFRVYAGYAGWSPGQLEMEIAAGGWHVLRADPGELFDLPSRRGLDLARRPAALTWRSRAPRTLPAGAHRLMRFAPLS